MHLKLKDKNGNIFTSSVTPERKQVIVINDVEYEVLELHDDNELESITPKQIAQFDSDPDIREMVEQSEEDIRQGNVFSTNQVIDMIRRGDI